MQPTGLDTVATYLSSAAEEKHPSKPRPQQLPAGADNFAGELAQGLGRQSKVLPAVEGTPLAWNLGRWVSHYVVI